MQVSPIFSPHAVQLPEPEINVIQLNPELQSLFELQGAHSSPSSGPNSQLIDIRESEKRISKFFKYMVYSFKHANIKIFVF